MTPSGLQHRGTMQWPLVRSNIFIHMDLIGSPKVCGPP